MTKYARGWAIWILAIVVLLVTAYVIIQQANPGLRRSAEPGPVGFVH